MGFGSYKSFSLFMKALDVKLNSFLCGLNYLHFQFNQYVFVHFYILVSRHAWTLALTKQCNTTTSWLNVKTDSLRNMYDCNILYLM